MRQEPQKTSSKTQLFFPLFIFFVYAGILLWFRFSLPTQEQIMEFVRGLYQQFGYLIVLTAGLIESVFLIGMYLPGSTAILLGAVLAKSGVVSLPFIILLGTLGMMVGYTVNYMLGKYGLYHLLVRFGMEQPLKKAEEKLETHGNKALFVGYLAPNGGAFISTAAGIAKMPFQKFIVLSTLSQLFWSTLWGTLAYLFGDIFIEVFFKYAIVFVYLLLGFWLLRQAIKNKWYKWF